VDSVPDAAARSRIHAAAVGGAASEKEAVGLYARDVLLIAADGDPGSRRDADDVPHDQCDLPSTIWDLPFLSEKGKHNILGGTAARLFKVAPRNEKQKENLNRFGNLVA
jgi:hypothetical protein